MTLALDFWMRLQKRVSSNDAENVPSGRFFGFDPFVFALCDLTIEIVELFLDPGSDGLVFHALRESDAAVL